MVSFRAFNRAPDQTAGSTTVTDLPDIKNIINVPGHGEMEREAAKALPNDQLLDILSTVPVQTVTKISEKLTYVNEKVAIYKTLSNKSKMIESLEKSLEGAKKSNNESMIELLTKKIEAGISCLLYTSELPTKRIV